MRPCKILSVSVLIVSTWVSTKAHADRVDENLQIVLEGARSLDWSDAKSPDQRAYLLIKTRTFRSPVALIFGYANNLEGCLELAADLTEAANARGLTPGPDLYVCEAVYKRRPQMRLQE